MQNRQLLFKVTMGVGGHEYTIYTNGEIEGFGAGALIVNYYPALLASDRVQRPENGTPSAPAFTTRACTSDLAGAGQRTPECSAMSDCPTPVAPVEK
jgi:hypothetical protein